MLHAFPIQQLNADEVRNNHASRSDIKLAQAPKSTEETPAYSAIV